jgi:DNA-binding NtrC family response regulator
MQIMHHILVVEDEPAVCAMLRAGLELDGIYRVTPVMKVQDAISTLVFDTPDAALIDVLLPDGSGLSLARHVMSFGVPVLLTTAHLDVRDRLEEAACPVLPKPFNFESLFTQLQNLIATAAERNAELVAGLDRHSLLNGKLAAALEESRRLIAEARNLVDRGRPQRE